jgi:prolyl-tRNA synthetase
MLCARRDTFEKTEVSLDDAVDGVKTLLADVQKNMLEKARAHRDSRIVYADDMQEILAGVEAGKFVKAGWCGCRACEDKVKEETAATSRVYVEEESKETCAVCGEKAKHVIIYARAY